MSEYELLLIALSGAAVSALNTEWFWFFQCVWLFAIAWYVWIKNDPVTRA